jgi:hypothetical protein
MKKKASQPKHNPNRATHLAAAKTYAKLAAGKFNSKELKDLFEGYAYAWVAEQNYFMSNRNAPEWLQELKSKYVAVFTKMETAVKAVRTRQDI